MSVPGPASKTNDEPDSHPEDGATFGQIVRYVMKQMRYSEDIAVNAVLEVLNAGIAVKKIIKTERRKYVLADNSKPAHINYKIRDPRFSEDSSDFSEFSDD